MMEQGNGAFLAHKQYLAGGMDKLRLLLRTVAIASSFLLHSVYPDPSHHFTRKTVLFANSVYIQKSAGIAIIIMKR